MKFKKINTIPGGVAVVIILIFEVILTLILGLALLPKHESIGLFLFSLIFIIATIDYINQKHWNFISVYTNSVCHSGIKYYWKDVYITAKCIGPRFIRKSFDYYIFFDDHYLTNEETESKKIKRKGFYLILTPQRADFLFSLYPKQIALLNENNYRGNEYITEQIKTHNSSRYNNQ